MKRVCIYQYSVTMPMPLVRSTFTGDMPIIFGPDGPSLGGFVCPAVVINSELWKLGQLKAGDKVKFVPVSYHQAKLLNEKYHAQLTAQDTQAVTFDESFYPEISTLKICHFRYLKRSKWHA